MRVLITRPEREATTLATALGERGHAPLVAPLFRLDILHPPADFAEALVACQAVLLTSANGARALAEASPQRAKPVLAVGDTTAGTAEGLGFTTVASAAGDGAALVELVRQRLDPKAGPLIHVAGTGIAVDLAESLGGDGYDVRRVALYEAREETALPEPARAALQERAVDVVTFFSPRAASVFGRLIEEAGLGDALQDVTAVAISAAALVPLAHLPFKATVAAVRPTRQAVLDEIDRLAEAGVQGQASMSDTPSSPTPPSASLSAAEPAPPVVEARRGIGIVGAFITGIVAASAVLALALISLPFWPEPFQALWRGKAVALAPTPAIDLQAVRADASTVAATAVEAAKRELTARLDDLDKRVRAAATAAAERPAPTEPALAELRSKVEALERRAASAAPSPQPPAPAPAASIDAEKELAILSREIAALRTSMQALDQSVAAQKDEQARQREQTRTMSEAIGARGSADQKALIAARASAVIGVAARLSAALESGLPFTVDLGLLAPLVQGDARLAEITSSLQPYGASGVASRTTLAAEFPAVAKAALADDLADDSFGERLLGKLRGLVSLRRVGDVEGDSVEARLARAETALEAGDLAKAVAQVKSLPPQTGKATEAWLKRADAHLAAERAVQQLAAHAVTLLGTAR